MKLQKNNRLAHCCLAVMTMIVVTGCRPNEPAPTYNEDLGTDETVLLPTASTWHDPGANKGQADWRPFRKPGTEVKPVEPAPGEVKAAGANQGVESELRGLVDDFNAAVTEGKFDEAADFLIEEQIPTAKQVVEFVPLFAGKLKEVVEVLPGDNENFKKVVAELTLLSVFKLDVASITVSSPTEGVGKLAPAPGAIGDVRFVLVKGEEEYWYIDHPQIRMMAVALPALQQNIPQFDAFIAGVKSGQIGGEALAEQAAAINQMIGAMLPPDSQPAAEPNKDEPEEEANPEEKAQPEEEGGG